MKKLFKILLETFIIAWIISFILAFAILKALYEFNLISAEILFYGSGIFSLVFSIIYIIIIKKRLKTEKKTKFENWLSSNIAKLMLTYSLLIIFLFSIKSELVLTIEDMKQLISICWTIFGISVAIFLIWSAIVIEYLERRKPEKPNSKIPFEIWLYIEEKGRFYSNATVSFSNVNLILVNLIFLIVTTNCVYVLSNEAVILFQYMSQISFFLCTNTVLALFLDILTPFNEKKKLLLKETRVSTADVDLQNEIDKQTENALIALDVLKNMENVSQETKIEVLSGIWESCFSEIEKNIEEKYKRNEN